MESTLIKEKKTKQFSGIKFPLKSLSVSHLLTARIYFIRGWRSSLRDISSITHCGDLPLQFSSAAAAVLTEFGKGRRTHGAADCLLLLQVTSVTVTFCSINSLRHWTFPNVIFPPLVSNVTWCLQVIIWKKVGGEHCLSEEQISAFGNFDMFCVLAVSFSLLLTDFPWNAHWRQECWFLCCPSQVSNGIWINYTCSTFF